MAGLGEVWSNIFIFSEADNHAALSGLSPKLEYIVCGATSVLTRSDQHSDHSELRIGTLFCAVQVSLKMTSEL